MENITLSQGLIVLGLLLAILEIFIGIEAGFDLVLIGSILILGGLAGVVTTSSEVAFVISAILSVIYILYGRTSIKKKIIVLTHKTNIDKLPGKTGTVVRSITPDTAGMVRIDDEDWRATSHETLFEKDKVVIDSLEGVTLLVKKAK